MGRRDKRRRRQRAQRKERAAVRRDCQARGVLPPWIRTAPETRDPRPRWSNLRLRGGGRLSLDVSPAEVRLEVGVGARTLTWHGRTQVQHWDGQRRISPEPCDTMATASEPT